MAVILMHPAIASRTSLGKGESEPVIRRAALLIAAPLLAIALSWGMLDAVAFTQSSLMQVYSATSSAV